MVNLAEAKVLERIAERLEAWADGASVAEAAAEARGDFHAAAGHRNERENFSALARLAREAMAPVPGGGEGGEPREGGVG